MLYSAARFSGLSVAHKRNPWQVSRKVLAMPLGIEQVTRAVARRSRRGLYAGRQVLSGNKVSEDGGNRSRRTWKPNVQQKSMYSEILDRMVPLRVTTHAIRCINKVGGLDAYILNTPDSKMQSDIGAQLREQMKRALEQQRRQQAAAAPTAAAAAAVQQPKQGG